MTNIIDEFKRDQRRFIINDSKVFERRTFASIARQTGLDPRVVKHIALHPFRFLSHVMVDDTDHRPVRINFFGVFMEKKEYLKALNDLAHMRDILLDNIDYVFLIMVSLLGFKLKSTADAKALINKAFEQSDRLKLKMIFDEFVSHRSYRNVNYGFKQKY